MKNLKSKRMHSLVSCFIVAIVLFFVKTTDAQITLEHTFDENISWSGGLYFEENLFPSDSYYTKYIEDNYYVVKTFNPDYSLQANNIFNLSPPAGYRAFIVNMSRNLFNTDDNFEFLVTYERTDETYGNTRQKAVLLDQNGSVLADFGFAATIHPSIYLHVADNNFRLLVNKTYNDGSYNYSYETSIYSVPGSPTSGMTEVNPNEFQSAYPNPTNSVITLPYQLQPGQSSTMRIYNVSGQLIESKQIDSAFDKILLNVSNYAQGIYLYEVNGVSKKFVVD